MNIIICIKNMLYVILYVCTVADPEGGGLGGLNPSFRGCFFFFCLSVYENSHGPGR